MRTCVPRCRPRCPVLGDIWPSSVLLLPWASVRRPGNPLGRGHLPKLGGGVSLPYNQTTVSEDRCIGRPGLSRHPAGQEHSCAPGQWPWNSHEDWEEGAWVAQSVKRLTSAQVTISRFVDSSPASGSVLTAQSLGPVSDSVSPSLSDPAPFMLCLSLSQK